MSRGYQGKDILLFRAKLDGGEGMTAALGGKKMKLPTERLVYCLFLERNVLSMMS